MTPFETEFYKMTAGGNDFILFDAREAPLGGEDLRGLIRSVCTRALSVGADGVIRPGAFPAGPSAGPLLQPGRRRDVLRQRRPLRRPPGVSQGDGAGDDDSGDRSHGASRRGRGMRVSIEMREPRGFTSGLSLEVGGERVQGASVDTGVPHFVVFRPIRPEESIETLGRALRNHPHFAPDGTNVNFIQEGAGGMLDIRTYERGVEGETLACGTGCVASALAAAAQERARSPVTLRTRSGESIRVRSRATRVARPVSASRGTPVWSSSGS